MTLEQMAIFALGVGVGVLYADAHIYWGIIKRTWAPQSPRE